MDHSMHHHSMHHDHSAMGGGDMEAEMYRCSMNMLFTWNTNNLCLVFRWWHITTNLSLVLSLLGVVALSAGYEFLRELTRRYEARHESSPIAISDDFPPTSTPIPDEEAPEVGETSSLLPPSPSSSQSASGRKPSIPRRAAHNNQKQHMVKGFLYACQVFYSFFIMLLFMTYNGWVMLAVAAGSFVGYILWGSSSATKTVACH